MGVRHPARDKPGASGPQTGAELPVPPSSLPCLGACPPAVARLQRSLLARLCTPKHPRAPQVSSACKHPSLWAPGCSWEAALGRGPRRLPLTPHPAPPSASVEFTCSVGAGTASAPPSFAAGAVTPFAARTTTRAARGRGNGQVSPLRSGTPPSAAPLGWPAGQGSGSPARLELSYFGASNRNHLNH